MKRAQEGYLVPQASRPRLDSGKGGYEGKGGFEGKGGGAPIGMGVKLLVSAPEASALLGPGGATSREIQQETGTRIHLSRRNEYYPGTMLQEISIKGDTYDAVCSAALHAIAKIVEGTGRISGGDEVEEGMAKTRVVIPVVVARSLIGKGGENIKVLRANTGCKVHIDELAIGEGDLAEQTVSLFGTLEGCQAGLPNILEKIAENSTWPWFSAWAALSNAGKECVATPVNKGGNKGAPKGGNEVAPWRAAGGGGALGAPGATSYGKGGKGYDQGKGYDVGKGYEKGYDKGYSKGAPAKGHRFKGWGEEADNGWGGGHSYQAPAPAIVDRWSPQSQDVEILSLAVQRLPHGSNRDNRQRINFPCPSGIVSAVIGKGGAGTKEIANLTGAKLMIREIEGVEEEKNVTISGTITSVAAAYIHVMGRITAAAEKAEKGGKGKGYSGPKGGKGAPAAAAEQSEEVAAEGEHEYDPLDALIGPGSEEAEWPAE